MTLVLSSIGLCLWLCAGAAFGAGTRVAGDHGGDGVDLTGSIQTLPASGLIGDWMVAGKTVHVTAQTEIDQEQGAAALGAMVEVQGTAQSDGSITASQIEVKSGSGGGESEADITGAIQSLPGSGLIGDWMVAGKTVHVTSSTEIDQEHGAAVVGATVEVQGTVGSDGSITAASIEVKSSPSGGTGGTETDFTGTIQSLPTSGLVGDWTVGGKTVHVTASTQIDQEHGAPAVGSTVEVSGTTQSDGSITAAKIEVKETAAGGGTCSFIELHGAVQSLPSSGLVGDWRVDGQTIHVTAATEIDQEHGSVAVGVFVEIKGCAQSDGSVNATSIEVQADSSTGGTTSFFGAIDQLPSGGTVGTWTIAGRAVQVDSTTKIDQQDGQAVSGAFVQVDGWLQADGSVKAKDIEVQAPLSTDSHGMASLSGSVDSLPAGGLAGDWIVDGRTIHVSSSTQISQSRATVKVGSRVKVSGAAGQDGSITASKIKVKK